MTTPDNKSDAINPAYFEIQADFGITKHMGGRGATDELISLCDIRGGQSILEVGCGVGATSAYLATAHDCRVTAVDISDGMIGRARERAVRRGASLDISFVCADAQQLPFHDGRFDAVIDESVIAFAQDKERAIREYVRVTKPGGSVGLNQVTWTREPPSELARYAALIMAGAEFLTADGWSTLLEGAGLEESASSWHRFNALNQAVEELRGLDIGLYLRAWYRFLTQSFINPTYRGFTKEVMSAPGQILQFVRNIGYGIYVGRKPD